VRDGELRDPVAEFSTAPHPLLLQLIFVTNR
jgi:hypothetical protein